MRPANQQRGLALVEILVALVISIFLLGGIVQVYIGNRTSFSFTNALAEAQESGRFALDMMSQDLRLASEWGCIEFDPDDTDNVNNTLNGTTVPGYDSDFYDFTGESGIQGFDANGLNGADSLTIRGGKPGQANVESPFFPGASNRLTTSATTRIEAGDIVLVARCGANDLLIDAEADILRVTTSLPTTGDTQRDLRFASPKSQQFENDAVMIELQTVNYFIAAGASGEPALFRQEFDEVAQELIEGVEDMQILYGVDSDGDEFPNQYLSADAVADFDDVVAVQVNLLLRSIDDFVAETPQTYTFNGVTQTPADRRIRLVFGTTIALRNRIGS